MKTSNLKTITAQHIGPLLKKPLELAVAIYSGRCDSDALSLVLCWASVDGHVELAGAAIEMGADVNRCWGSFRAPLFSACYHKHEKIVRLLVSAGADINAVDSNGIPAIVAAAFDTDDEVRALAMLGINAPPMATRDCIENLVVYLLSSGAAVPFMAFNKEQLEWKAALALVNDIASRRKGRLEFGAE